MAVCIYQCVTLWHMSIRTWIVVPVALKQVDNAPDTKPGSKGNHKGLQYFDCAVEKFHIASLSAALRLSNTLFCGFGQKKNGSPLAAVSCAAGYAGAGGYEVVRAGARIR